MARRFDPVKQQAWRDRFSRFESSGMKSGEFCAAEGVSKANFYAWRRKLGLATARAKKKSAFRQVVVSGGPALVVHLPGGIRVETASVNEQALRVVVNELVLATTQRETL